MTGPRSSSLRVRGLNTTMGTTHVLQSLSLPDLPANRLVALLGPNGCGKSTLLKSIAGLVPARCEALSMGATDLRALDAASRSDLIRYLPQTLPNDVHLTVHEAAMVAYRARGSGGRHQVDEHIDTVLRDLNIAHLRNDYLDELSGGQRQLASLAQALVHRPELLLLDEPLTSLDMNYQIHVMRILARLTRVHGLIVIVVLHDLNIALRYADHAWLLHQGRLIASGTPVAVTQPENLARAFSIRTRLEHDSQGRPHIFIDDTLQI